MRGKDVETVRREHSSKNWLWWETGVVLFVLCEDRSCVIVFNTGRKELAEQGVDIQKRGTA